MQDDAAIKSLVEDFYGRIDAQRWDEQDALIADDFVALLGSFPPVSFKAWQQKLQQFYKGFPQGHHRIDFYTVEGGRVLTIGHFIGTHDGPFFGHAPTGRAISMKVMHVDRVADGKLVEHIAQSDIPDLLRQISASEPS